MSTKKFSTGIFASYTAKKPEAIILDEGGHILKVVRFEETNSFMRDLSGNKKSDENLPDWTDPTPQLAVTFAKALGQGVMTHRFNGQGYVKWSQLSTDEQESGEYVQSEAADGKYALIEGENGQLVRVVDKEATERCKNILNQFVNTLGANPGDKLIDTMNSAVNDGALVHGTVTSEDYEGKPVKQLENIRALTEEEYNELEAQVKKAAEAKA